MQSTGNDVSPNSPPDVTNAGGITIPPLNGLIGHIRHKPSRVGLGDRQYSYEVTTGPSVRVVARSNPSPPPLHHRQYSEGAGGEKTQTAILNGGRNASVGSLDTTQPPNGTNGMDAAPPPLSGGRRRHGHAYSHAHSHHHHPSHAGPVPPKPASMMSTTTFQAEANGQVRPSMRFIFFSRILSESSKICLRKSWLFPST
jgi:hypothetical protein